MNQKTRMRSTLLCGLVSAAVAVSACNRAEETTAPPAEVQSEALQPTNRPVTVNGCLKAGDADNTFVLTAAQAEGGGETATYHLMGADSQQLRDRIGERVRVSGTLEARQTAAAQTLATPAAREDDDRPAATSGTPTVQTRTDVKINQLTVDSVEPLGEECGIGQ